MKHPEWKPRSTLLPSQVHLQDLLGGLSTSLSLCHRDHDPGLGLDLSSDPSLDRLTLRPLLAIAGKESSWDFVSGSWELFFTC